MTNDDDPPPHAAWGGNSVVRGLYRRLERSPPATVSEWQEWLDDVYAEVRGFGAAAPRAAMTRAAEGSGGIVRYPTAFLIFPLPDWAVADAELAPYRFFIDRRTSTVQRERIRDAISVERRPLPVGSPIPLQRITAAYVSGALFRDRAWAAWFGRVDADATVEGLRAFVAGVGTQWMTVGIPSPYRSLIDIFDVPTDHPYTIHGLRDYHTLLESAVKPQTKPRVVRRGIDAVFGALASFDCTGGDWPRSFPRCNDIRAFLWEAVTALRRDRCAPTRGSEFHGYLYVPPGPASITSTDGGGPLFPDWIRAPDRRGGSRAGSRWTVNANGQPVWIGDPPGAVRFVSPAVLRKRERSPSQTPRKATRQRPGQSK